MSDTLYFYADGNEQRGPLSTAEILALRLAAHTLVWCDGMRDWARLDSVAELAPAVQQQPAPAPFTPQGFTPQPGQQQSAPPRFNPQPFSPQGFSSAPPGQNAPLQTTQYATPGYSSSSPRDRKITAGLFGIFLGGLGIHKFILGYTTAGLIMCLVTVFTCGWAGLIFGPIGFIEGIIYLTKTDEDFYNTYVMNKREWF